MSTNVATLDALPGRLAPFAGDERVHLVYRKGFDVTGLCCRVKSSVFEKHGWVAPQPIYPGMVKRWGPKKTGHMVILFEGDDHGLTCDLAELLLPEHEFEWIDYADGRPRPRVDPKLMELRVPRPQSVEEKFGRAKGKAKVCHEDQGTSSSPTPIPKVTTQAKQRDPPELPAASSRCSGVTEHFTDKDSSECASPARTQSNGDSLNSSKKSTPDKMTPPSKKGRFGGAGAAAAAPTPLDNNGDDSSADASVSVDSSANDANDSSAIDSNGSSASVSKSSDDHLSLSESEASSSGVDDGGKKRVAARKELFKTAARSRAGFYPEQNLAAAGAKSKPKRKPKRKSSKPTGQEATPPSPT